MKAQRPPRGGPAASSPPFTAESAAATGSRDRLLGPRRWIAILAIGVVLSCPALALTWRVWADPLHTLVGEGADQFKFSNFLAWVPHRLAAGHNPLHTSAIDAPAGLNLTWDTPVPLAGILMWPVTATLGVVASFNAFMFLAIASSGWASYAWLRRHAGVWGALAGAIAVEICPFMVGHALGHLNLLAVAPLPLLFICLEELLSSDHFRWRLSVAAGLLAAAQMYLSEELMVLGLLGALAAAVLVIAGTRSEWRQRWRPVLTTGALAVVIAAGLVLPMAQYQFLGPDRLISPVQPSGLWVTDLQNLLVPTSLAWVNPDSSISSSWVGNAAEWTAYVGIPGLLLALYAGVRWWRNLAVRTALLSGFLFIVLSLGPHLRVGGQTLRVPLPEWFLDRVPVINNVLPGRLSLLVAFAMAFLVATVVDDIVTTRGDRWRRLGAGVLATATLVTLLPNPDRAAMRFESPPYFQAAGAVHLLPPGTVALVTPVATPTDALSIAPMIWQAQSNFAYSMDDGMAIHDGGDGHAAFFLSNPLHSTLEAVELTGDLATYETDAVRRQCLATLHAQGITAVLAGPGPHRAETVAFLGWLLISTPTRVQGVDVWNLPTGVPG